MKRTYHCPNSLEELLALRNEIPKAAILAGGTDLLVYLHEGKIDPPAIIDIGRIGPLRRIFTGEHQIVLGAAVTFSRVEASWELQQFLPGLCQAAASVGSPQIRNRGTIGGSIVNANPSSDVVPALVVADAKALLLSTRGSRTLALDEFILGSGKTALAPDEILYEIHIPRPPAGARMQFCKIGRRNALSIARLNGACYAVVEDGVVRDIRILIGAATNRPMRMSIAEGLLTGVSPDKALLAEAGDAITAAILNTTGRRSSSVYKLPVAAEFSARLIRNTLESEAIR